MSTTEARGDEGQRKQKKDDEDEEEGGLFREIMASAEKAMAKAAASSSSTRRDKKALDNLAVDVDDDSIRLQQRFQYSRSDSKDRRRPLQRRPLLGGRGGADDYDEDDDTAVRDGYHRRLATYGPHNFFGKPPSISPVVCARFGCVAVCACLRCDAMVAVDARVHILDMAEVHVRSRASLDSLDSCCPRCCVAFALAGGR
jgi:C3HC zinc finger-like